MSLFFRRPGIPAEEFAIEDMDQETGTITVGVGWGYEECSYDLSRDEARQVWEHLGKQLGYTEN